MATKREIAELYVATFNRAADADGLAYWDGTGSVTTDLTDIEDIAQAMLASDEAAAIYAGLNREDTIIKMYDNLFNRTVDASDSGVIYWVSGGGSTVALESMILALINGALGADAATISNKTDVGQAFANAGFNSVAQAISIMQDVTSDYSTVTDAVNAIEEAAGNGNTFYLQPGQEFTMGTAGNDTFIARGNSSLDNADIINGGDGIDTIEVMLDNNETAESPLVTNVEVLKVQGQQTTVDSGDNDVDSLANIEANIDAGDMSSVEVYWSEDSRADVTIEDVSRNSNITTIGMRETDPGDVDYNVFFDPENIVNNGANDNTDSALTLNAANLKAIAEGDSPFTDFDSISFYIDGAFQVVVDFTAAGAPTTYAELKANIDAQIAAFGYSSKITTTLVDNTASVSEDIAYSGGTLTEGTPIAYQQLQVTATDSEVSDGFIQTSTANSSDNFVYTVGDTVDTTTTSSLTQTDIILDRVGKNSKGGDLLVGSDSTGDYSGSAGIEQFNVYVDRDSWLNSMSSTNNTLEVVNVENLTTSAAAARYTEVNDSATDVNGTATGDLRIDSLTDVRVFDAASMIGDVTLTATLSDNIVAKYLDVQDTATDSSADNSEVAYTGVASTNFYYNLGSGDDTLDLTIDSSNLELAGNSTREDFVLEINGNDGDDSITLTIEDQGANGLDTADGVAWYDNQKENANITINGGAGNDMIHTAGAGDVTINAGSGNDTVYTDIDVAGTPTAGTYASWTVNSSVADVDAMNSLGAQSTVFLYGATLTVTYSGASTAGNTGVTQGAADAFTNGFESTVTIGTTNYVGNQTNVNQAIKAAILGDGVEGGTQGSGNVLEELLTVNDGPANTLAIHSLIDGTFAADDLQITIQAITFADLSTNEQNALIEAYKDFVNDSALTPDAAFMQTVLDNAVATANAQLTVAQADSGFDSFETSDNIITLGAGDDVAVLGIDNQSNDTLVYEGTGNGTDTIVNFTTADVVPSAGTAEQQTIQFSDAGDLDENGDITVNVLGTDYLITVDTGDTAEVIAQKVETAIEANAGVNVATDTDGNGLLTIVYELAAGNAAAATVTEKLVTDATGTVQTTTPGVNIPAIPAAAETLTATFTTDGTLADGTAYVSFDSVDITVVDTDGSGTITAFEIAQQVAATTFTNYTVTGFNYSLGQVSFAAVAAGAQTTVEGDFSYDADGTGAGTAVLANNANGDKLDVTVVSDGGQAAVGATLTPEVQSIAFTGADRTGTLTLTIDGTEYDVLLNANTNAGNVAAAVEAQLNGVVPGVTIAQTGTTEVVTFTWATAGDADTITIMDGAVVSASVVTDNVVAYDVSAFTLDYTASDMLDFNDYLDAVISVSGSTASQTEIGISLNTNTIVSANEVVLINDFADYGTDATLAEITAGYTVDDVANLVGTTYHAIFMVENGDNDGEYMIYDVQATNDDDFTSATLVGTVDFGNTLVNFSDANLVG